MINFIKRKIADFKFERASKKRFKAIVLMFNNNIDNK